jgi:hypothetical protein
LRLLTQGHRLGLITLTFAELGEVFEAPREVGVAVGVELAAEGEAFAVEGFGFREAALARQEDGEVVDSPSEAG